MIDIGFDQDDLREGILKIFLQGKTIWRLIQRQQQAFVHFDRRVQVSWN